MKRQWFMFLAALVMAVSCAEASITVSMGTAYAVNDDYVESYVDPAAAGCNLISAQTSPTLGNVNAIELVVDMGSVKTVEAILLQNRAIDSYGVPWDIRVYVAPDESAAGFDYLSAASFTQELTPGARTPLSPSTYLANEWKSWTLPTSVQRRYIKIDVTGTGFGGVNSSRVLAQWQDIDATYAVPEPATLLLLGLGGLVLRRRA